MNRTQRIVVLGIFLLAALLRFTALDQYPYGVNQDEAERGYEAYSLLKTGHDQHGHPWPLTLEAFSALRDNASAISAYAAIPFTAWLGPGLVATRLPSAVAGLLTVLFTYALAWRWSKRRSVAALAALTLAVSPWHLALSRLGHESVWVPCLFLAGLLAFSYGRDRRWGFPVAAVFWAIGLYGYATAKLFEPLALVSLVILFWNDIRRRRVWVSVAVAVGLLVLIPFFTHHLLTTVFGRLNEVGVATSSSGPLGGFILNIFYYLFPNLWVGGYLGTGPLDWIIILLGIPFFFLLARPTPNISRPRWVLSLLLLAAIIVPSLTIQNPNALRASGLIGLYCIAGAWGLVAAWDMVKSRISRNARMLIVAIVLFASSAIGIRAFFSPSYTWSGAFISVKVTFIGGVQELVHTLQTKYASVSNIRFVNDWQNQPQAFIQLLTPWNPVTLAGDEVYGYCSNLWIPHAHGSTPHCVNGFCNLMLCDSGWYATYRLGKYTFCDLPTCMVSTPGTLYVHLTRSRIFGTQTLDTIPIKNVPGYAWIISR